MEYCEGESLDVLLKREKVLPVQQALEIVTQVARGLKHAHDNGFVHRDIKPANILLTQDGVAKILDLGLSKQVGEGEQSFLTHAGTAMGTPHYISPEQAGGRKDIDGRSDIYSLGASFYHLVTGQTPFQGATGAIIMTKHINEQPPNPEDIRSDIPDSVVHIIRKMMAKSPNDRYRNCEELLADLEPIIAGRQPSSLALMPAPPAAVIRATESHRPRGVRRSDRPPRNASPAMAYLGVGGGVVALAVVFFVLMGGKANKSEPGGLRGCFKSLISQHVPADTERAQISEQEDGERNG